MSSNHSWSSVWGAALILGSGLLGAQTRAADAKQGLTLPGLLAENGWCRYPGAKAHAGAGGAAALIAVNEVEPNGTPASAQPIPLGDGAGEDRDIDINGNISPSTDTDYFRFTAVKGDVIGIAALGAGSPDTILAITDAGGTEMVMNDDHWGAAAIYPPGSPFPGGTDFFDSVVTYVVPADGDYWIRLVSFAGGSSGPYTIQVRSRRPAFELKPAPTTQTIFLDFDGATINPDALFGGGPTSATLSPLSSFLAGWGLAGSESAVIDSIIASVEENFDDLRIPPLNGDRDSDGIDGHFDVEILNSRDHADPFGSPNVSRLIIGGTIAELGISTIGIAQFIDPGNFGAEDTAVVLLDILSAPTGNPDSINTLLRTPGFSMIDAVGLVVGNVATHEAGHYLGNWHTENGDNVRCIMDQGGDLPGNMAGVGADGVLGTADDEDPDFNVDIYETSEPFEGFERTDTRTAFGLATGSIATCDVPCFPGMTPENEPGCGLPSDSTNGGCNSEPPVFSPIACGDVYCGTGAYDVDLGLRDTDWYAITTAVETEFTWTVTAEFDVLVGIVDNNGIDDCTGVTALLGFAFGAPCETISITTTLPPGTWWFFVAPDFITPLPCGASYVAALSCSGCDAPPAPHDPTPADGALEVAVDTDLQWNPVRITFDEVPFGTPVDGMVIADVAFGFSLPDARVTLNGPPPQTYLDRPQIEGTTAGVLTLDFAVPVFGVSYGFALNNIAGPAATTMALFDASLAPIASVSADANWLGFNAPEGWNTAISGVPIARAVITLDPPAPLGGTRFVLDNLTYYPSHLSPAAIAAMARPNAPTLGARRPEGKDRTTGAPPESLGATWVLPDSVQPAPMAAAHTPRSITTGTVPPAGTFAIEYGAAAAEQEPRIVAFPSAAELPPSDCIIVNGGFETGDLSGWTLVDSGNGTFVINDGTLVPPADVALPPCSGNFSVVSTQTNPGIHTLYQDVAIPAGATVATLRWTDMIRNHASQFENPNQAFRVEVRNPANDVVLATLYETNPGMSLLNGCTARAADLSAFIGETIRIAFTEQDNLFVFNVHLDDVCIELDAGCLATYNTYLDVTDPPGTLVCGSTVGPVCEPGPLDPGQEYFWRVVADVPGGGTVGPVWIFRTGCTILDSDPPNCRIDPGQPTEVGDASIRYGWDSLMLAFECGTAGTLPTSESDFLVTAAIPIAIVNVTVAGPFVVLEFDQPVAPGQWTCITHLPTGEKVCLGYLPGDVNGDGTTGPSDILAVIDSLNGVVPLVNFRVDVDRSGVPGPPDILRVIDLLNGAGVFDVWFGATLGPCPAGP